MVNWQWRPYNDLSIDELHALLKLRVDVFIVEQQCIYPEIDGLDPDCDHLLGTLGDGSLAAYLRIIPPKDGTDTPTLGRIATAASSRGDGIGRELVERGITACHDRWPDRAVTISAQLYLQQFYAGFGFTPTSDPYEEDGIPHIAMRLDPR